MTRPGVGSTFVTSTPRASTQAVAGRLVARTVEIPDPGPLLESVFHLRHRGHEVIVFHILDEAEVHFPFDGMCEFEDVETPERLILDAKGIRDDYLSSLAEFRERLKNEFARANVDYVPMDTSVGFDKALLEYLTQRQRRF